jgi:2-polyprenyl-6-methoxyphenol hydroxylase-like FAD-dependent oxidoreductase
MIADAVIVGGGPAGAALARRLARRERRVLLLDAGSRSPRKAGESLRGIGRVLLAEIGLASPLPGDLYQPAYAMRSCWEDERVIERDAITSPYGPDMHVDRSAFDAFLLQSAEQAGATMLRGAAIEMVEHDASDAPWTLTGSSDDGSWALRARFLVDATGRRAWLSRKLGGRRFCPDPMIAVCRWYRADEVQPFTLVESAPEGWCYTAPLPRRGLLAVWMTDPVGPTARAGRDEVWSRCLATAPLTRQRLAPCAADGEPLVCAAGPTLTEIVAPGFLPIGDAAMSFDPIAPDGLCFALRSAIEASIIIESVLARRGTSAPAYREGIRRIFEDHLARREAHYRAVRRFPGSAFWNRSRGYLGAAGASFTAAP